MKWLALLAALPLAAAPLRIYVTNSAGDNVTIIDPRTNHVTGEIHVSKNPHGIVPSPDGKRFYVSSETENVLDVVDRTNFHIIRRVPIGERPNNVAITPDGRRVYICIRGQSWVDIAWLLAAQSGILSFPLDRAWARRVAVPGGSSAWVQYAGTAVAEGASFDVRLISENVGQVAVDDIELTPGACLVANGPVAAGTRVR